MFPQNLESWIYLLIAAVVGLSIGQWIRQRRIKREAEHKALTQKANRPPRKRVSKKERLKVRRQSS